MGTFQKLLDDQIERVPRAILTQLVEEKLEKVGRSDAALAEKITNHILNGEEHFEWPDDGPDVTLEFGDEDFAKLEELSERFTANLPDLIQNSAEFIGKSVANECKSTWQDHRLEVEGELAGFRQRLRQRWSEALDGLGILLQMAREQCEEFDTRIAKSKIKRGSLRNEALSRLHMRACQVTAEIICLLENGFADAAMSRWRTLYEISTVATLIADGGDELADRYLAHEIVERKKSADEFQRCAPALGERRIGQADYDAIKKEYAAALRKYGQPFRESYGWAAGFFGGTKPNFRDLQAAADRADMHIYYKLSSHGIHAGPSGLTARVGLLYEMQFAGATNAVLEMPGANTAYCIVRMMGLLRSEPWELDDLAMMRASISLRDETYQAFERAAAKLERDEARERQRVARLAERQFASRRKRRPIRQR